MGKQATTCKLMVVKLHSFIRFNEPPMKKLNYTLLTILIFAVAACSVPATVTNESPVDYAADKAALEKRVAALTSASLSGNLNELNDLTSDKLSYGHSNGDIQDKRGFVDSLATKNWTFTQINIVDQKIADISGGTALVRQKLYGEAKNRGKAPAKLALGILLVWKKENAKWVLYGRQAFKLLPPNDVPPVK